VDRNDVCVFVLDAVPELTDVMGLAGTMEDVLQSGCVHHTICHPIQCHDGVATNDQIFNLPLPLPYRLVTDNERTDIADWAKELRDHTISMPVGTE
jgi:hypothetical protein